MTLYVSGNTYPYRSTLKSFGFRWAPSIKSWTSKVPLTPDQEETLSKFQGIEVEQVNGAESTVLISTEKPMTYKQRYGRCEDAPCCGCCGPQFY